mmetsp:Transcript_21616/g.31856  ORF Transcript_21616/g.31856 Transcript_21616/m.31856 type:complete len:122 (-) Transcript_21616:1007-1372(-)
MVHEITEKESINEWFSKRTWSVSGNRVGAGEEDVIDTKAERVVFPRDTEEVSQILSSLPPSQPVAVVCGGHSSSNTSTVAVANAVVVDLQNLNSQVMFPSLWTMLHNGILGWKQHLVYGQS